ncbi:hypothetical protein A2U01_0031513, partial [Trifolium medium]|nr:hypothetical protein [Trifolium medium]
SPEAYSHRIDDVLVAPINFNYTAQQTPILTPTQNSTKIVITPPPGEHEEENHQVQLDRHTTASTTHPPRAPSLTTSSLFFFDPLMFGEDDTDKLQGKYKTMEINTKMEGLNETSFVLSDRHDTHCGLPVSIPTIIPPPEPPDKVVASVFSRDIHRAAIKESSMKTTPVNCTTIIDFHSTHNFKKYCDNYHGYCNNPIPR